MKKIILKENRKLILTENKQRKKKGFTIIEMSVVIAIMLLLMVTFLPTVSGAIEDSKEAGIRGEAQTIVFAWQTINSKTNLNLKETATKGDIIKEVTNNKEVDYSKYFNINKTKSLSGNVTVEKCLKIIEGDNFTINDAGEITIVK